MACRGAAHQGEDGRTNLNFAPYEKYGVFFDPVGIAGSLIAPVVCGAQGGINAIGAPVISQIS